MKVIMQGYKILDTEINKEKIEGIQIWITYKTPGIVGFCADKVYVSKEQSEEILQIDPTQFVGEQIDMEFDRKGRLVSVTA